MHTGYDNFWMYQNNRPEPVLSLPKNDNCSNAVLTDSYKQVLNGGGPSHLSSCISQNSVARSHHSDQFRMTSSQYGWPSSVYSLPFRSSYANNFHSQEAYSNHSNSISYSSQNSQIYQNYDSRYLRNLNFPYVNNVTNSDNCINTAKAQSNANTNAAIGRIRVKDVFSLNNNALFDNNLLQSNQIDKRDCSLNNAAVMSYFTTYQTKTSSKCVDYEKNNLHESNNPTSTYECATAQQSLSHDHQQYPQHSVSFYQQKNQSLPSDALQTDPLTGQFYNTQKIQRTALNSRRNSNEALRYSKRLKIQPRRNSTGPTSVNNSESGPCLSLDKSNDVFFSDSLNSEEKLMHNTSNIIRAGCSQSDLNENLAKFAEANSFKNNSLIGKLRKWRKNHQSVVSGGSSPSQNQLNGQEKNMIKITYPHSGQSSFLFLEDSDGSGSNSNLSLPCLLEPDSQLMNNSLTSQIPIDAEINAQVNVVVNLPADQVIQENENHARINAPNITQSNDSHPSTLSSSPRALKSNSQNLQKKEPVVRNEENSNAFLNSDVPSVETSENFFQEDMKISIKANLCNKINSLIIKQEVLGGENQNGECVLEHQIFHQIIKTEENPVDPFLLGDKLDFPESENLNPLKKVTRLDFDNTENIDVNSADAAKGLSSSKKIGSKSKTMSSALKNADNRIKEQNDLKNSSKKEKKKCSVKKKKDKDSVAGKKVCSPTKNYKSEINRDKLDLLIEFLNKEEDTADSSRINETNCPLADDDNDKMKKDVESNRSRRKLSKTCIVKNKNNTREMVSLISHKIARVEILKCSPVTPQTLETNKKLDQSEDKKASSGVLSDKSFEFSDNHSETGIPFQTVQAQKDRLEYEKDANVSEAKECQDPSKESSSVKEKEIREEENIINTMRAFQTLKTHFCMSCNLNSGISSFWINVVSGELRCLNCFKKMLKTEDNVLRLKEKGIDCKDDLEGSVTQKDKMNETVENEDKNNTKTRTENDQSSTIHFTESQHGRKTLQDVKENIKQEVAEKIIESAKDKIVDKDNEKQSLITKSSNPTKRSVSVDDNASLEKIAEDQKDFKMMELKNSKLKENTVEGCLGQDIKELQSRLKKESFTKEDKFPDKGLEHKASPVKLKENCSVGGGMPWNSPNPSEGKDALKKGSLGPKLKGLENYKEELSDGSKRKNISKEMHISVENLKHVSGECKSQNIMDKSEKSCKKNSSKQEGASETLKKLSRNCQDQVRKSRISKDEFICQKAHNWEERRITEVKLIESDKSVAKQSTIESCSCRKTICLDNSAKKNCRHEPSEKIKVQSPLKETHKSAPASNSLEKHKKTESPEQTRKRKNSEDGFVSYKVRAVEDPSKPVSHTDRTKETTKECSSCYKNKTSEHKKINLTDAADQTKKSSVSKKETKQPRDAAEKWKTKSDHSEHLKHKGNDWSEVSRGKNQKEFLSSAKQHAQNEIKNNAGFEDKLKRCNSKEDLPKAHVFKSFSREIQNGNLFPKVKDWEKTEEKERKYFCGKIPKRCFPSTDRNLTPGLKSPLNYKPEEMSHVIAKKDHYSRIGSSNPNRKLTKESFNKGNIYRKKEEEKSEANNNKRAKEVFRNEGSAKSRKQLEGDSNQRKGAKNQTNELNKGKAVNYFGDRKDVSAEKAESASLMARLIQKTKKLSWSLLKES